MNIWLMKVLKATINKIKISQNIKQPNSYREFITNNMAVKNKLIVFTIVRTISIAFLTIWGLILITLHSTPLINKRLHFL